MAAVMLMFVLMTLRFMEPDMLNESDWKAEGYGDLVFRFGALMSNSLLTVYFIVLSTNRIKRWQFIAIFGPPLVVWLLIVVMYLSLDEADQKNYIFSKVLASVSMPDTANVRFLDFVASQCYLFLRRFYCVIMMGYSFSILMAYRRNLLNYFSDIKGKQLLWNRLSLLVFLMFVILLTVPNFDQSIVNLQQGSMSHKAAIAMWSEAYIFFFGMAALRMNYPAARFVAHAGDSGVLDLKFDKKQPFDENTNKVLLDRYWTDAMYNNQMFLRPMLTLDDVAKEMQTSRRNVLAFINAKYNMVFYRVIQHFRIQHAKELLEKHSYTSMEQLAKQCGFLSTELFIKTYQSLEHKSPKAYSQKP
jgi:AraC-like DNA-binding protein